MATTDDGIVPGHICYAPFDGFLQDHYKIMGNVFGYTEEKENALSILFSIIGSIAVFGNGLAIYFFLRIETRNTASKIFYMSFAIFDLLTGVNSCFTGFLLAKGRAGISCSSIIHNKFISNFFGVTQLLSIHCTTYIITLMSISRCVGVLLPFRYKEIFTPRGCFLMIGAVVLYPVIFAMLPFFYGINYFFHPLNMQFNFNYLYITKETPPEIPKANLMRALMSQAPLIASICVMLCCSLVVAVYLINNQRNSIGVNDTNRSTQIGASITILLLATIFGATYSLYLFLVFLDIANKTLDVFSSQAYFMFVPIAYLVFSISSSLNPFVYHLRGKSIFQVDRKKKATVVFSNQTRMSIMTDSAAVDRRKQSKDDKL